MTMEEVSRCYLIPQEVLKEYESWGGCSTVKKVMGDWQYDDTDLERLSLIMTLHDIGFEKEEIEVYLSLMLQGNHVDQERLQMLNQKRQSLLDEIHFREKKLENLDYLRFEIHKMKQTTTRK